MPQNRTIDKWIPFHHDTTQSPFSLHTSVESLQQSLGQHTAPGSQQNFPGPLEQHRLLSGQQPMAPIPQQWVPALQQSPASISNIEQAAVSYFLTHTHYRPDKCLVLPRWGSSPYFEHCGMIEDMMWWYWRSQTIILRSFQCFEGTWRLMSFNGCNALFPLNFYTASEERIP